MPDHSTALTAWESFYVIVGSAGGALIGLQFVVLTLIADRRQFASSASLSAFGTPTVVHLTGALFVSAIMSAPWTSLVALSFALAACAFGGVGYGALVFGRARRQTQYTPVWQDWLWYAALPWCAYAALAVAAIWLHRNARAGLSGVAASALGLLLIGIHNAWDTVTHIVVTAAEAEREEGG